jgi:hypothetical protein
MGEGERERVIAMSRRNMIHKEKPNGRDEDAI